MKSPMPEPSVFPVILAVPAHERTLRGRDQVIFLSRYARYALELSANKSAVELKAPTKNADGVPQPTNGIFWSVTHKPDYVGAVVAGKRIGIDLENIRPCSDKLFKKVGQPYEWGLSNGNREALFFRYWTSKETVLKATGVGFKGLSKCRVASVQDDYHLEINFQDRPWPIEHCYFDGHIASVLAVNSAIQWTILDEALQPLAPENIKKPDSR